MRRETVSFDIRIDRNLQETVLIQVPYTVKAHSSLASILFRLNAGLISIIDRFTRGDSTRSDYQTLVNLSNTSRIEAINTFEQLSSRLSRSQLSLQNGEAKSMQGKIRNHSKSHKKHSTSARKATGVDQAKHLKSKSAPELSVTKTALGPATPQGWVRPKSRRKVSSSSSRSGSSSPRPSKGKVDAQRPREPLSERYQDNVSKPVDLL